MVVFFHNCSVLLREKIVLVIEKTLLKFQTEGQEFAKFLRSIEQFIRTVKGKKRTIFETECFFDIFLEVSVSQT